MAGLRVRVRLVFSNFGRAVAISLRHMTLYICVFDYSLIDFDWCNGEDISLILLVFQVQSLLAFIILIFQYNLMSVSRSQKLPYFIFWA